MAKGKKRKVNTDKISVINIFSTNIKEPKPTCFNSKQDYCRKELCGEWFEKCKKESNDNSG